MTLPVQAIPTHEDALSVSEVVRVLTLQAGHNTTVVTLAAATLGLAAGLVGAFALLRKRTLVADALAHATLPGIAGAFLLAALVPGLGLGPMSLPVLLVGAAVAALLAAWAIQLITRHTRIRQDAAIGIVLSSGNVRVGCAVARPHRGRAMGGRQRRL